MLLKLNTLRLLGNVSQKQNKLNKTQYISAYKAIIRSSMMDVQLDDVPQN
jgi:hypothetical protein